MTDAAVRAYAVGLLDAITWPIGGSTKLTVYETTPKGEPGADLAIVLGLTNRRQRVSVPRGGGQSRKDHVLHLMLQATDPNESTAVANLDQLKRLVEAALETTTLPATATDPVSADTSTIVAIGEEYAITVDWTEDLTDEEGEGEVRAYCMLECSIWEQQVRN